MLYYFFHLQTAAYLTGFVQLLEYFGQLRILFVVVVEFAEFEFGLEPKAIVFRFLQRQKSGLVEILEQVHLRFPRKNKQQTKCTKPNAYRVFYDK